MKISLPIKLACLVSAIIVANSALLSVTFISKQIENAEKNLVDKGTSLVTFFADQSQFGIVFYNHEQLESIASSLIEQNGIVCAVITGENNEVFISQFKDEWSKEFLVSMKNSDSPRKIERVPSHQLITQTATGEEAIHFSCPIFSSTFKDPDPELGLFQDDIHESGEKKRIGTAHLVISMNDTKSAIEIARRKLMIITFWIVIGGVITSILLSMYVTKPVQKLVDATHQISDGNLDISLPAAANDEVGDLSKSFNKMVKNLREARMLTVHETKKTKEALARSEKLREAAEAATIAKSDFLANMSHELRTPLHAILSYSSFGIKKFHDVSEEKLYDYFDKIKVSGMNLLNLVNALLDLSKLESGKSDINYTEFDFNQLVSVVRDELMSIAAEKDIDILFDSNNSLPLVMLDTAKIKQVLRNLLGNAIKFSAKESTITIRLDGVGDQIRFAVIDQGLGIPENEFETIFDKFIQSSKTKSGAGGTGLGLAICRQIIVMHSGRIWAENNSDRGAIFQFEIPVKSDLNHLTV